MVTVVIEWDGDEPDASDAYEFDNIRLAREFVRQFDTVAQRDDPYNPPRTFVLRPRRRVVSRDDLRAVLLDAFRQQLRYAEDDQRAELRRDIREVG